MSLTIPSDHSSDHFLIFLTLGHPKPTRPLTTRISRKLHSLPITAFISDLSSLPTSTSAELHTSLSSTLDKYAPLLTKTSITRLDSSWYTISLLKQKRTLRKAEKSYLKHPSPTSFTYYDNLNNLHRKASSTAKDTHITHKFDKLANDSMSIHRLSAHCLVVHLKPLSPLKTLKNYHFSSKNLSTTNFSPPFTPFPSLSFPSPFPSPLTTLNLPHLIKSSPFSNLPP